MYAASCAGTSSIVAVAPAIVTVPRVLVAVTLAVGAAESVATSSAVSPTVTWTAGGAIDTTVGNAYTVPVPSGRLSVLPASVTPSVSPVRPDAVYPTRTTDPVSRTATSRADDAAGVAASVTGAFVGIAVPSRTSIVTSVPTIARHAPSISAESNCALVGATNVTSSEHCTSGHAAPSGPRTATQK